MTRYLVKVKEVAIEINSLWECDRIKQVLEALAYTLNGVDCAGDWKAFNEELQKATENLLQLVKQRRVSK